MNDSKSSLSTFDQIRSYCLEIENKLQRADGSDEPAAFRAIMRRIRPGLGPQSTEVEYHYTALPDEEKPWEPIPVLLLASISGNIGPRNAFIEYIFESGALVRCRVDFDVSVQDGCCYYFHGKALLGIESSKQSATGTAVLHEPSSEQSELAVELHAEARSVMDTFHRLAGLQNSLDLIKE